LSAIGLGARCAGATALLIAKRTSDPAIGSTRGNGQNRMKTLRQIRVCERNQSLIGRQCFRLKFPLALFRKL
jgi:hypothetical protein